MPPQSTTRLSRWEFTKPPKISYFLLDFLLSKPLLGVLSFWPLSPSTFPQFYPSLSFLYHPCLAFFNLTVFPTFLPWHRKCYATDIEMMMPWIWCLNAIIPPPCSLLTSPPPSMLCREGGSLRETLAHNRICSHLKFPSGTAAAFSSSEPSNLLFFSSF